MSAFLKVWLLGFGGGLVWARRIVVDQKRWMDDREFADTLTLCQFMPGPNIVGITVCVGSRLRASIGSITAARLGTDQHCRCRLHDRQGCMNSPSAASGLAAHLALLSSISFGGFPSVLPDVHNFVIANGWVTDREFGDCSAVSQVVPGTNMILMMGLVGLKVGGIPGAVAAALATFGPPCLMYYACGTGSATPCGNVSTVSASPR